MSKRDDARQVMIRLRLLIKEARGTCENPNSVPHMTHFIVRSEFRHRIASDKAMRDLLISDALSRAIRAFIKHSDSSEPMESEYGVTESQISFWPEPLRKQVKAINRRSVFVPSCDEFRPLIPGEITRQQVGEAGEYLLDKGRQCLIIGRRLIALSGKMT